MTSGGIVRGVSNCRVCGSENRVKYLDLGMMPLANNLGTSRNAVMSRIWIALFIDPLLASLKYLPKIRGSMRHIIRLLQLDLFARRDLADLLRGAPPDPEPPNPQAQLPFA